jgi:hypothetical protein
MSSKENLKRCGSTAEKKNAGSKKSKPQAECCVEKPGSDEAKPVHLEPATTPVQTAGKAQAAEDVAAIVTALSQIAGSSGSFPRKTKPRQPRPRMRLAEAMRARGLDEHLVARVAGMFIRARVSQKKYDKLLVDVVEDVIRVLEPPRPADRIAAEPPAPVQLIHYVDRPEHENPSDESSEPFESRFWIQKEFAAGAVASVHHVGIAAALLGGKKKGARKLPERLNIPCVEM